MMKCRGANGRRSGNDQQKEERRGLEKWYDSLAQSDCFPDSGLVMLD